MYSRLRRPLAALAFVALAMVLPPATASTSGLSVVGARITLEPERHPESRAAKNAPRFMSVPTRAATLALRMIGTPYRWGGESPASGFDCSGLIRWAYAQVGVDVPHSSFALYDFGRAVSWRRIQTGDVLVFSGLGHVGLYLGGGRMVHAPQSGRYVEIVRLAESNYGRRLVAVRRVVPA